MSFATRCSACGTIFRVVPDQLKVSDGWVRCGRCDAVFDAAAHLFDLERETPPEWQPAASPPVAAAEDAAEPVAIDATSQGLPAQSEDERRWSASMAAQGLVADDGPAEPVGTPALPEPEVPIAPAVAAEPEGPSLRMEPVADTVGATAEEDDEIVIIDHTTGLRIGGSGRSDDLLAAPDSGPSEMAAPPDFLRPAGRPAIWQNGRARAVLTLLAALLVVTLVGQVAHQQSEALAARWPVLRPALTAWCGLARCSVGPPHRIDDIVVENTALSPVAAAATAVGAASSPAALRLAVTLRNRAGYAVAVPSIDLSLTDISGKLIARRALSPADFQVLASAVPASSELPLQAVLTTAASAAGAAPPVAGYTVEIFYP